MENLITRNFKGIEIIFKEIEGQHMVRIDEVAKFCGWTTIVDGKEYLRLNRANKHLKTLALPVVAKGDFIPEFAMYALIGKANNAAATEFMLWVGQTLTELRTKGVVILDHASQETINFEEKFGKYRIRRTFTESNNLREDWKQLKTLSREQKLNGTERLKLYNITFSAIQDRLNNNLTELRGSELLAMQELLTEIKSDTLELSNRVNGGKKSNLTKKLNMVNEQLQEAQEMIRYAIPEEEDYYWIDIHGFTVNRMYEPNVTKYDTLRRDFNKKARLRKTTAYEA